MQKRQRNCSQFCGLLARGKQCFQSFHHMLIRETITGAIAPPATTTNTLLSTITGRIEPALTTLLGASPSLASFEGRPLLTGSCSQPYFAQVTDPFGEVTRFPAVGCSNKYANCCPFDFRQNAVISRCPQDYFTTNQACCPSYVAHAFPVHVLILQWLLNILHRYWRTDSMLLRSIGHAFPRTDVD